MASSSERHWRDAGFASAAELSDWLEWCVWDCASDADPSRYACDPFLGWFDTTIARHEPDVANLVRATLVALGVAPLTPATPIESNAFDADSALDELLASVGWQRGP